MTGYGVTLIRTNLDDEPEDRFKVKAHGLYPAHRPETFDDYRAALQRARGLAAKYGLWLHNYAVTNGRPIIS